MGYGGWHFSFLGDIRFISDKINDFSHQEFNNEEFNTPEKIQEAIENGLDMFGRDFSFKAFDPEALLPSFILGNQTQYGKYLRKTELSTTELQDILGSKGKPSALTRLKYKWEKRRRKASEC